MRLALAQITPTVGDVDGNTAKIAAWIDRAREAGAELVIFPELCVPGYPAEDLYLKRHFLAANVAAVERLAQGARARDPPEGGVAAPGRGGGRRRPPRLQLARRYRRRRRPARLPQEPPPQLLRLRRAALLRAGQRRRGDR